MKNSKCVAITGAGGQIAYSLIFKIASGEVFGKDQPIDLRLLEVPEALPSLKGVVMELEDCAYSTLKSVKIGSDPNEIFENIDLALLVGAKPRGPGMERKELLFENGKIFETQGKALNHVAKKDAKILVIGNPCNTNCLIAMHAAPKLNPRNFFALTRLDENRARFQLAHKASVSIKEVEKVTIWGNHSSTQVPDFDNALIGKKPVTAAIHDKKWLEETFITTVQKRGAEVIAARGKSSAASAAQAIVDNVKALCVEATPQGSWFSQGCLSDGNPYGIPSGLIFSFPCKINASGHVEIVSGLTITPFLHKKMQETLAELQQEKEAIAHLLKS